MKPETSIVIPYHQEGVDFITETINSIRSTIDIDNYEIIVVDDGSKVRLGDIDGATVIRHKKNRGVGAAFDTGVAKASGENLFIMGSDIRFVPNRWASLMLKEINEHPKAITCSTCVGINKDNMDVAARAKRSRRNGSTILMFHDHKSHKKKPANFRNIIECQWMPIAPADKRGSWEIPCVLGAFYGLKKSWYEHIDGFWGHRSWGTLEPLIGLKSWLFGGSNRTTAEVQTGHIFKSSGTHGTPHHHLMYNKMLTATLLFDEYHAGRLINFLGKNPQVLSGEQLFNDNKKAILKKRREYEKKIVYDIKDYVERWNIDFRDS